MKLKKKIELYTQMRDVFAKLIPEYPNISLYLCTELSESCIDGIFPDKKVEKFVKELAKFGKKHVPGFYRDEENLDAFAYEGIFRCAEHNRYNKAKLQHIDMYLAYLRLQKLLTQ